jgi:hypothetical protein
MANELCSDISEAFPNGEFANLFRADWLTQMARDTRASKEFSSRTQDTARWARDQIKRQSGKSRIASEDYFYSPWHDEIFPRQSILI